MNFSLPLVVQVLGIVNTLTDQSHKWVNARINLNLIIEMPDRPAKGIHIQFFFFISEAIIVWISKISHSYGQGGASFYQSATSLNPKCKSDPKTRAKMMIHGPVRIIL